MILTMNILKQVFLDVIKGKITFLEASDWASEVIRKDEYGEIELDPKEDIRSVFSGVTYLSGVDIIDRTGEYLHSIENIQDKYNELFLR